MNRLDKFVVGIMVAAVVAGIGLMTYGTYTAYSNYKSSQTALKSGDLNGDGLVDSKDLSLLLNNWSDKKTTVLNHPNAATVPARVVDKPIIFQL